MEVDLRGDRPRFRAAAHLCHGHRVDSSRRETREPRDPNPTASPHAHRRRGDDPRRTPTLRKTMIRTAASPVPHYFETRKQIFRPLTAESWPE